ncbi:MAG: beta-xylosidase [Terriglobia bacterium]
MREASARLGKSRSFEFGALLLFVTMVSSVDLVLSPRQGLAQQVVTISVQTTVTEGTFRPSWAYFGHDEPNFTYGEYGRKLLVQLAGLNPGAVHIRTHNLLTSGDGTPRLKWGSTNVYSEDAAGRPVYDWTILDRIFDAYRAAGIAPFVEIGFMPKALSTHPEPYQHNWPEGSLWTGWAYPPRDYGKWRELIRQWVLHSIQRYGREAVHSWNWEVWNEPDIGYWQGTPEEYYRLYDFTADAVKRTLPQARVGGPATTGPAGAKAAEFLRNFLDHCVRGQNNATGKAGAPLDFISFHAKGRVQLVDGHVQMGIQRQLEDIAKGFEIVASFPELRRLPVVLSESDPEGCAACSVAAHPENAYRNSPQYAAYNAAVLRDALELAKRYKVNLQGVLTWAFEFEDQPYFAGFRALRTRDIDLPVLNGFRMLGLMDGERVQAESSGGLSLDRALSSGARSSPDINALATRGERAVSVLVWNYQDDVPTPPALIHLTIRGIITPTHRALLHHYRIDETSSDAYSIWKKLGSPQEPSAEQHAQMRVAGQLQLLESPQWVSVDDDKIEMDFQLPSQGISLVRLSW